MPNIQQETTLAPETVTRFSTGDLPSFATARRRRRRMPPLAVWAAPKEALETALAAADGDPNWLWIDQRDGAVWTLNHPRWEECVSVACPFCSPR